MGIKQWAETKQKLSEEFYDGNVQYTKKFLENVKTWAEV